MLSRVIRAMTFVAIATAMPLAVRPELMLHPKILVLFVAGMVMLLTQPDLRKDDAADKRQTDRWSVLAILVAGLISQIAPVVEWGYSHSDLFGNPLVSGVGLAMIAGGLAFRIWSIRTLGKFFTATVQIVPGHRVIKHGPYGIVRHPSYLGAYLAIVGVGVFLNASIGTLIGAIAMLVAYRVRLRAEETTLLAAFGNEYEQYRQSTPMILPLRWSHGR